MSINAKQLREEIIRPTLVLLGLHSEAAEDLLFGTAVHESHLGTYIKQVGGPALGIYQMEPATYDDIWNNYIGSKAMRDSILAACLYDMKPPAEHLIWNLRLATIMCRLHYMRKPGAIPNDLQGQAKYWKEHYNTQLGKGTVDQYLADYRKYNNVG